MNNAQKAITDILTACGCAPAVTANGNIKINAPAVNKKCETCARRETCKKSMGAMFGYCTTDYLKEV